MSWSNGLVNEDADGQRVLYQWSKDSGYIWSPPIELFRPALNASQSPSAYNASLIQRALCSEGFLQMTDGRIFALAEIFGQSDVTGILHEGTGLKATGFGRVAREVNSTDGTPIGEACWLQPSRFASRLVGTPYDVDVMRLCDEEDLLVPLLSYGANQPAWSWSVLSSELHHVYANNASSQSNDVTEATHAVVFNTSSVCRLWRMRSPAVNRTLYIECTNTSTTADATYNGWYNGTDELVPRWYSYPDITATNIPDANSKSYLGAFPPSSGNDRSTYVSWKSPANLTHFLLHNPCHVTVDGDPNVRFPLTLSTSTDNSTFTAIASLHPMAPIAPRFPDPSKNRGYFYPSAAIQQGTPSNGTTNDTMIIVYAINKEDIGMSIIRVVDIPRVVPEMGAAGGADSFGKGFVFFVLCILALVLVGGMIWSLVWVPATAGKEVVVVKGKEVSGNGWVDKKVPLTSEEGGDEYYEDGEEEDEDDEEYEDDDEEEVEEKNGHALVTSADVAHLVSAPHAQRVHAPASAPARVRKV